MVQKVLHNEIIDKYKINRCIPVIQKNKNKNKNNKKIHGGFFNNTYYLFGYVIIGLIVALVTYYSTKSSYRWMIFFVIPILVIIPIVYYLINNSVSNINSKKPNTIYEIFIFSILIFLVFIIINIIVYLLVISTDGSESMKSLKKLKLDDLKPINILYDYSNNYKDKLNNTQPNKNVDEDYFDLNNFVKPPIINQENIISIKDATINQNNPSNNLNNSSNNLNIPQFGFNSLRTNIFDNKIKVVEKDIYNSNDYFNNNPTNLKNKLIKYFRPIVAQMGKNKRYFITFEVDETTIANSFLALLFKF